MKHKTLLHIENLTLRYKERTLCKDISFDVHEGDCIMLCGANGSGKTTLLKAIAACPDSVMIPTRIPKVKGFTLEEFIKTGCFRQGDIDSKLDTVLKTLSLDHLKHRDISTLSDGEFQKGCIAIAMSQNAGIIILDEPTAFLDPGNRMSVLDAVRKICSIAHDGVMPAVIFSTHDLHEGLKVCNRIFAIDSQGRFRSDFAACETFSIFGVQFDDYGQKTLSD